jgi:hypothetical protein
VIRFVADENFHLDIVRGAQRKKLDIDLVRVQDVGLLQAEDPVILAWAAMEGRIVLTHDVNSMIGFARDRVSAGLPMPGLFIVKEVFTSFREVIDSLLLIAEYSEAAEWEGRIAYLPLK